MKQLLKKPQSKFIGPYYILLKISAVTYKLELLATMKIHPVFHVSLLRCYTKNDNDKFSYQIQPIPAPIQMNNEDK